MSDEVTQADREAAIAIMWDRWNGSHKARVRNGTADHWIAVREAKNHRIQSTTTLRQELAEARAEVEFWKASCGAEEEDVLRKAVWRMGWPEINAYHDELKKGQDIREDAGGFFMRAIGRLFGVKPKRDDVITYQDAATAMVDTLLSNEGSA